eukprot:11619578-Alexandrium_andersonii.AAC.1
MSGPASLPAPQSRRAASRALQTSAATGRPGPALDRGIANEQRSCLLEALAGTAAALTSKKQVEDVCSA